MLRPNQVARPVMRFMSSAKPYRTVGSGEASLLKKKFAYNNRHVLSYMNGGDGKIALIRLLQILWPLPFVGYVLYGDKFGTVRK
ncbi:hypothetical protein ACF0H5_002715 [Mactra antiquata]